jgi:hypothetical protein
VVLEDLLHGKPLSAPVDDVEKASSKGKGVRVVNLPADQDEGGSGSSSSSGGSAEAGLGSVQQRSNKGAYASHAQALNTEGPDAVILDLESPHKHAARRVNSMGAQARGPFHDVVTL